MKGKYIFNVGPIRICIEDKNKIIKILITIKKEKKNEKTISH